MSVRPLVISCEHGGNRLPGDLAQRMAIDPALLASHRGWDAGALDVARALSARLTVPLIAATTSRLVVDLNRSPHNPRIWSAWASGLTLAERNQLLERFHRPHWKAVEDALDQSIMSHGRVVHIAVHSFTPVWNGLRRRTDLGLLYNPRRPWERELAGGWSQQWREALMGWVVHRNQPYVGHTDGLPTAQRRRLDATRYAGFELELNQARLAQGEDIGPLVDALATSFAMLAGGSTNR